MGRTRSFRAFTLVELLIGIGIIALLIGILLPTLARAQAQARSVACRSNLRQIAMAAQMYAQEQKVYVGYIATPLLDRKMALYPYLRQGKSNSDVSVTHIWHCPSNRNPDIEASYGFNANLNFAKLSRIRKWSETVAVVDGGILDTRQPTLITHCWPPSRLTGSNAVRPNPRHINQAVNVAMADGHVEAMQMVEPFYPGLPGQWFGNGVTDPTDPEYKDHLWDLR